MARPSKTQKEPPQRDIPQKDSREKHLPSPRQSSGVELPEDGKLPLLMEDPHEENLRNKLMEIPNRTEIPNKTSSNLEEGYKKGDSYTLKDNEIINTLNPSIIDNNNSLIDNNTLNPSYSQFKDLPVNSFANSFEKFKNSPALMESKRRHKEVELSEENIQPISSVTNTHQSYTRVGEYVRTGVSRECLTDYPLDEHTHDPLAELRNIAKIEANVLQHGTDRPEEAYFSPPARPAKDPLDYLKRAVSDEERGRRSTGRDIPAIRMRPKRDSLETEGSLEEDRPTELEDAKFSYNQETKLFYCPWEGCGKFFPSLSRIKRHYIIHTKEKPFKCLNKECGRRFSRKDNMLQHFRVHCPYATNRNNS